MSRRAVVIGAGINGLVAAYYLKRAGCDVTLLEKKEKVGGACTFEWVTFGRERYAVPTGASVLGLMQDFVFRDTGLDKKVSVRRPAEAGMVFFGEESTPLRLHDDTNQYAREARQLWNETGDLVGYSHELERVRKFLCNLYQDATVPTWELARENLGEETARRWITGSAAELFRHYFTSDRMKIFKSMPVTESGPVDLEGPSTAFNIAANSSGSVLDGNWGFVKGALWSLLLELADINRNLGIEILTSVHVEGIQPGEVTYTHKGISKKIKTDAVFLATDPITAAKLTGDSDLQRQVASQRFLGSSGKVVLVFREPAQWKHRPEAADSFRFFYDPETLVDFEASNQRVRNSSLDFSPCSYQVYPEGAAMRPMGWEGPHDYLSVFFKDLGLTKKGTELPTVKQFVTDRILSRIENPEALIGSVLYTPRDCQESFFFPEGNIDHMQLCEGQNYFARTFSSEPSKEFYRLGSLPQIYYCGAGSFPCGSVAGTPGYMAVRQWTQPISV